LEVGRPTVLLAGIMLGTMLVPSPVPGDRTPPLHLGFAAPMDAVVGLLESEAARAVAARLGPEAAGSASPPAE
jgi:hypothetical protein